MGERCCPSKSSPDVTATPFAKHTCKPSPSAVGSPPLLQQPATYSIYAVSIIAHVQPAVLVHVTSTENAYSSKTLRTLLQAATSPQRTCNLCPGAVGSQPLQQQPPSQAIHVVSTPSRGLPVPCWSKTANTMQQLPLHPNLYAPASCPQEPWAVRPSTTSLQPKQLMPCLPFPTMDQSLPHNGI